MRYAGVGFCNTSAKGKAKTMTFAYQLCSMNRPHKFQQQEAVLVVCPLRDLQDLTVTCMCVLFGLLQQRARAGPRHSACSFGATLPHQVSR